MMNGKGRKIHVSGEYYVGEFRDGLAHGYGEFRDTNGGSYEGMWERDKFNGRGKQVWNHSDEIYEGSFLDGTKHGKGKFTWKNGSFYDGDF